MNVGLEHYLTVSALLFCLPDSIHSAEGHYLLCVHEQTRCRLFLPSWRSMSRYSLTLKTGNVLGKDMIPHFSPPCFARG